MLSYNKLRSMLTILILAALFTLLLSGCGAQTPKVYRVGILLVSTSAYASINDGFKAQMTKLGYIEGQNVVYETLESPVTATPAEAQAVAKKFVDEKVDLIFTYPTPPTVAAHAATQGTNIPVVFAISSLEGLNLVKSVREPGGNMTGVRYPGPEMIGKRMELLVKTAPQVKRVWIGYDKNHPNTAPALEVLRPLASSLGVTLVEVPAATLDDLKADLAARAASPDIGLDAIVTMNDGFNQGTAGYTILNKFAAEHKVPLAGSVLSTVQQGAVLGNSPNLTKVGEMAASLADKILKGTPAGTIPVVTPEQELYINYKVAQELGLTIPEGLLQQAAQIIR
jgi:putative tryptophan/tyrosine transport system substrate-binding protein